MRPVIRPSRREDEAALKTIDLSAWEAMGGPSPKPDGPDAYRFFDWGPPEDFLVAEVDGELAGFVKLGDAEEIEGLAVHDAWRSRGVGQALARAAVDEARRRGLARLTLRVAAENAAARAVYRRCGFRVEPDDGDDVLMVREI